LAHLPPRAARSAAREWTDLMPLNVKALALAAVAVAGGAAFLALRDAPAPDAASLIPASPAAAEEQAKQVEAPKIEVFVEDGIYGYGDPDAPVTVIEYASLTCPHCASFHTGPYQDLKRDWIETGKVKLMYREVYFDRLGLMGAQLARCGDDDRYFGFIDVLLRQQDRWAHSDDPVAELKKIGRLGGLSDAQVEACLNDEAKAREMVEMFQSYRDDPRLTGTPTLIVADEKVENPTAERLSAAIETALGE
jgi:protein-disulfide isomerase